MTNSLKYYLSIIFIVVSFISVAENSEYEQLKAENLQFEFDSYFADATKQKMLGNYKQAINLYLNCLKINPNSAASMYEISKILYLNGDYNGALELMQDAVKINDKNLFYLFFIEEIYMQCNKYKEALSINDKIITLDGYNENNYYDRINLLLALRQVKAADKVFDVVEKKFGVSNIFLEEKVKFFLNTNKLTEGEKMLLSMAEENPYDDRYMLVLAELYSNTAQFDKALDAYEKVVEISGDTSSVHLYKSDIYYQQKKVDEFVKEFKYVLVDESIDVENKIELITTILADSVSWLKEYEYDFIELLYNTYPNNIEILKIYSGLLIEKSNYEQALKVLYEIFENDKTDLNVYIELLNIEYKNKNWDTVYNLSSQALELYPNQFYLYYYKGSSALLLENYDVTINTLLTGVTFCPENNMKSDFYSMVAEAYMKQNNKKMSFHFFEKSLSLSPENVVVLNNYGYYLAVNDTLLDKALEMSEKANNLDKENYVYLDTKAWVLYKMQRYSEAKEIIEKAVGNIFVTEGDDFTEIYEHYGDILYKLGDVDNAVLQWNNAIEKGKSTDDLQYKIKYRKIKD